MNQTSMLFWYSKVKDLPIPQPRTVFSLLTDKELKSAYNESVPDSLTEKVKIICDTMGYPIFLRTDLASAKHSWNKSCFYDGKTELWKHLYEVISFNLCADQDFKAIAVREYVPMDSRFTAFYGDMPVNPERRYFVKDGTVLCHHPYWIEEAIEQSKTPSLTNWRELVKELNTETEDEIKLLTSYAELVAKQLDGYWSVDFCKAKDGRWILIDLADGEQSWHPKHGEVLGV